MRMKSGWRAATEVLRACAGPLPGVALSLLLGASLLGGAACAESLADYAGTWEFAISGDDQGKGTAVIDAQGHISGVGAAAKLNEPLLVSGQVEPDGKANFTASPRGNASSGATFSGQLVSTGRGTGRWQNTAVGLSGRWTAQRTSTEQKDLPTQQTFECQIDGRSSNDPGARADLLTDVKGGPAYFRVVSILRDVYSMDVKARRSGGAGVAPIVNDPGWSTSLRINKHTDRMEGHWTFSSLDMAAKRATGVVEFRAGSHSGSCRFALFLFVADLASLPIPSR